ncbi:MULTISPECIES: hypothetical protein [unclassified Rhodanobacter]|uniref:Uncharacterized protein n=1 Tax=Rhodanobacter humi TaxID=1888173 RepID=A0ABV4ARC2_9GAMM
MMNSSRGFAALLALQLCVPAVVYLLVDAWNGSIAGIKYFLPNCLYMAAPLLLVSLLAIWPRARSAALIWALSLLNAVLVVFQFWVLWFVPARESGLAWVLYIPVWGLVLLACAVAWVACWYFGPVRKSIP